MESNDEKIRKWLIDWAKAVNHWSNQFTVTKEQIIDWLEKQGENKPTKNKSKTLDPDKVIEWLDEHIPTKFEDMQNYVNQFKKDFEL